jgi:hypothetical protein
VATTTTNLGLTLPTPNVDTGWGSTLNTDFTLIDNIFASDGTGTSIGIFVGTGKTASISGTLVAGGTVILGSGDGTGTVTAPTIRGAARTGTNVVGADLTFDAANGTGTGGSGSFIFRTAAASTSGTTANTLTTALTIGPSGVTAATPAAYANTTQITTTAQVYATVTTVPENAQTGTTYTLVASDKGKMVTLTNSGAITLTVPASVFAVNDRVDLIQYGAGQVTVSAGAGLTLRSAGSRVKLTEQYSAATLWFKSATEAALIGDLTT